jgi:hypothetical protein
VESAAFWTGGHGASGCTHWVAASKLIARNQGCTCTARVLHLNWHACGLRDTHVAPAAGGQVIRKLRPANWLAGSSHASVTLPTPARVMFLATCRWYGHPVSVQRCWGGQPVARLVARSHLCCQLPKPQQQHPRRRQPEARIWCVNRCDLHTAPAAAAYLRWTSTPHTRSCRS